MANLLRDEAVTLRDTSLATTVLNTLDGNTTGAVNAATVTTLTGTAATANTAYASRNQWLGDEAVTWAIHHFRYRTESS